MNKLIAFFYMLLQNHLPAGAIDDVLVELEGQHRYQYPSKPLHDLAISMASRLSVIDSSSAVVTGYQVLNAFPATAHVIHGHADDSFFVWKENEIWMFQHIDSGDTYEYRIVKKS